MKEFDITVPPGREPSQQEVLSTARRQLGLPASAVPRTVLLKCSIDARKDIVYRYRYVAYSPGEEYVPFQIPEYKDVHDAPTVIVVGAGPAGMFAALKLLNLGLKPVILERGKDVHRRKADMAALSRTGVVDPDSNYCYGEGGAGAFSDGKLFTRSTKRGDVRDVLYRLVAFGASEKILTDAHPHIGSDKLPEVVENIRKCIEDHGGEYHFDSRVTDIQRMQRRGAPLQAKGFALGVRVEHPQHIINTARYHGKQWPGMPAAEYSFVEQVDGRGVFSFCMCPGGILVPSMTEEQTVVLNGMSNSARNSKWANSGVVVSIEPEDIPGDDPFRLMDFQRDVERRMYAFSGSVKAPAQRMKDFCHRVVSEDLPRTSYFPGAVSAPLHELLPEMVASRLRKAFPLVNINIRGYYTNDALLLGVESRTSSPVRIPRDPETLECLQVPGLYPCGEGAGYSGGIVSSALDGIRCALAAASKA